MESVILWIYDLKVPDPNTPPVDIHGYKVPKKFEVSCVAMLDKADMESLKKNSHAPWVGWDVSLLIRMSEDAIPQVEEILIKSTHNEGKFPFVPLSRSALETVENQFHSLIEQAVIDAAGSFTHVNNGISHEWFRGEYEGTSPGFRRVVQDLSHRRPKDYDALFERVANIYNAELREAMRMGRRPRMILEVMTQLNTKRGTAENWVMRAKNIPGLIESVPSQISQPLKKVRKVPPKKTIMKGKK